MKILKACRQQIWLLSALLIVFILTGPALGQDQALVDSVEYKMFIDEQARELPRGEIGEICGCSSRREDPLRNVRMRCVHVSASLSEAFGTLFVVELRSHACACGSSIA